MLQPTRQTLYPYQLCERHVCLQGEIALSSLVRLADMLSVAEGVVTYQIDCSKDVERYHRVQVRAQAQLPLDCQRCLTLFHYPIEIDSLLSPVKGEQEMQRLPEAYEPLLVSATESVALSELIEEELMLAMPLMPMHPDQHCPSPVQLDYPAGESITTEAPKPFAVLNALRSK